MRTAQQIGAECLGRLRRDQRRAVEGGRDPAVLHLLHSVHAGYPGGRRSFSPRGVEHGAEEPGRRERARGVVDRDPVVAVAAIQRCGDAVLAALAALDEDERRKLRRSARSRIASQRAVGAATTTRSKQPAAAMASSVIAKTGRPPASAQSLSSPVRTPRPKAGTISALLSAERPWRAPAAAPAA